MKHNDERMLTTHAGSLLRTQALSDLLVAREQGRDYDTAAMAREARAALDIVLEKQFAAGVDIGCDGEMPRVGFSTYVAERIDGFGGVSARNQPIDMIKFPEFADFFTRQIGVTDNLAKVWNAPKAQGELHYDDTLSGVREECALFADGLAASAGDFAETFMTAASPGIVSTTLLRAESNKAYADDREYALAVARELKKEYDYVVGQGHILQLDAPDLAMERVIMFAERPLGDFLARVELHIEAMNVVLADVPPDRVRLHVCWGNWQGPHQDGRCATCC